MNDVTIIHFKEGDKEYRVVLTPETLEQVEYDPAVPPVEVAVKEDAQ